MEISPKDSKKRKIAGLICIFGFIINSIANIYCLRTGDIHTPQLHIYMRWGWFGFWLSTILFTIIGIWGLFLLITSKNTKK